MKVSFSHISLYQQNDLKIWIVVVKCAQLPNIQEAPPRDFEQSSPLGVIKSLLAMTHELNFSKVNVAYKILVWLDPVWANNTST